MSKQLPDSVLHLLAERVSNLERDAVEFVREGGSPRVVLLLGLVQQEMSSTDALTATVAALAELGLLHALRLYLGAASTSANVPAASVN